MAKVERDSDVGGESPDPVPGPAKPRAINLATKRQLKRSETIARDLAEYIVESQLPAGAMLPREKDMVEQLGVGRTTLREALRILETRGVLTIRSGPGGGPVVRHPQPNDLSESLTLILQFQRATMIEVLDARILLEASAARLAASHITSAEISRLRAINAELEGDDVSTETGMDANERFHRIIASTTGNVVIQIFLETLLAVADSGADEFRHTRAFRETVVEGHNEIIDALEARDPDGAADAMARHVSAGKRGRIEQNRDLMSRSLRWVQ